MLPYLFGTLVLILTCTPLANSKYSEPCVADRLTVYRVVMNTYWSKKDFPKHYPMFRPSAQFSKLIGRSHDESFLLFELNRTASEGVRIFAETGASDVLDQLSQGEGGIYDEFIAPSVLHGVGSTHAEFFVDGNHSRVSLISRIVPSPDWFVGISSYDLCSNGRWVDSVMIEVDPLDAGSDNGLTFTSPNWPTDPRVPVRRLTPRHPNHQASSFFYPDRETLPPIATFQFHKVKEYALSEVFHHPESEILNNDVTDPESRPRETNLKSASASSSLSNGAKKEESNSIIDYVPFPENRKSSSSSSTSSRDKKRKLKKFRPPKDCQVTEWSSWTPCSKVCGLGEMTRSRGILTHARRGGNVCPPLKQAKWCGSARSCSSRNYFNWANRW
ncbi:spondin-2 [Folsomia candida]|uniref:spondin-2 n=1 Tax=Folsomia candida TaxID=158441 RepID=UPI000B8F38C8|nr:spondin-2 [Folsomia candida]